MRHPGCTGAWPCIGALLCWRSLCCGKPPVQLIPQGRLVLPVRYSLPGLRVASFLVVCCCARLLLQACLRSHARGAVAVAPPAASQVLCWLFGWHGWVTVPNSSAVSASAAHLLGCSGYLVFSDWQHACAACQARPAVLGMFAGSVLGSMRVWAFCPCNIAGAWCFLLLSASLAALGAPAWLDTGVVLGGGGGGRCAVCYCLSAIMVDLSQAGLQLIQALDCICVVVLAGALMAVITCKCCFHLHQSAAVH